MKMYLQRIHICITFFLCGVFAMGNTAYGQNIETIYTHTASQAYEVLDTAELFTDTQETNIKQKLQIIEEKTTAEGAIVTIQTTNGESIADIALKIGREWGIGKKDTDNGFVILIAASDKQWFISTGDGLEGTIPDLRAFHIGEKNFPDNFRRNDYASGILMALNDIEALILEDPTTVSQYEERAAAQNYGFWIFLAVMLGFTKTNLFVLSGPKKQYFLRSLISTILLAGLLGGITMIVIGIGFMILYWPIELASIYSEQFHSGKDDFFGGFGNWSSGGGGGGFSSGGGFGGGGFSGGGAGGSW